ncbi:MAG TPA: TlpA disulfide reductase family protein [Dehalococcoidia bacterium]|nr:TlpA disulfide reductase family protein [Dehalococcoidia bacterium]
MMVAPFELADLEGRRHRFPTGRATLLAFLKEDCPTCNTCAPLLETAHRAFGDTVAVLAVGQDEGNAALAERHGFTFPVLDDAALRVSFANEIETVPTLVLTSPQGEVQKRIVGFDREEWQELFVALAKLADAVVPPVPWADYPAFLPGCGSKSVEPGIYERLQAEAEGSPIRARRIEIAVQDDEFEFMFDQGFTDGLPVVPPTAERVLRMLGGTRRDPQEVVAIVPPNMAPCTVEKVAINAVMAGCKPEYLPVVITAVEAACTDEFNAHGVMATTMGASPAVIVNGPIRNRIGMNAGLGALGQGNRANATIGRALRLVLRNVGGAKPGGTERSTLGNPMKYTFCFAEWEERSPWEPYHVEHGFRPEDSVVTLIALTGGPQLIVDQTTRTARAMAGSLALGVEAVGHPKSPAGDTLLVVCPEHVDTLWEQGMTKADLRQRIIEVTTRRLRDRLETEETGGGIPRRGFTEEQLEAPAPKFRDPRNLHIVVAGGDAGKFSAVMAGWASGPGGSMPVSRRIQE